MYNLISDVVGGVEIVVLEETLNPGAPAPIPPQPYQADSQNHR